MKYLLLLITCFGFFTSSYAQPVFDYDGNFQIIGKHLEILEDKDHNITAEQALHSTAFKPSDAQVPNLQITSNAYWVRFSIRNRTNDPEISVHIAHPIIDKLDFYHISGGIKVSEENLGDRFPLANRRVKHQTFIFPLHVPKDSVVTCLLRVQSGEQLMLPIYVGNEQVIYEKALAKDIIFGIYLGIMMVMILYNLFVYITVKDKNYLYYVGYLFIVMMTQASLEGFTYGYLLPTHPFLANLSVYIFSALIGIAAIEFTKNFLNSKEHTPKMHKGTYVFTVLYCIAIVLTLLDRYNDAYKMILMLASTSAIYVLTMAVRIRMKGSRSATYFLVAWSIFIVCVVVYTLKDFGVFPYNFVTNSALQFGSAVEAILLSFALADKINYFKAEKERMQQEAFKALQENERLIREQNVILEAKVEERTKELQQSNTELEKSNNELEKANDDLEKAYTDLQEKETQLVESEKMASLGQLTAGIAHEINNPINFVTSNVNPLKRDITVLTDMISQMEALSLTESPTHERQRQLESIKTDADYDYLKTEIDYLLKGISEGANRTAEIVKGLRVFSRLDEDDLKRADVNEGLNSTIVIVNHLLNNVVDVNKEFGDLPMIECYPGKLNQVFLNIMSNAIHAIHKKWGGVKGGVLTLETMNRDSSVVIKMRDNGTGMDESTKKKLFEPFFTTKDVGEGTGLGLSIVYNTIRKHSGTIEVNSELGEGSEFVITLPIFQS